MTLNELFAQVLQVPAAQITDATSTGTVKGWDSFNHIQLVTALEELFQVKLSMAEVRSLQSVGRARELLRKKGVAV